MVDLASLGPVLVLAASVVLNLIVLAYRWPRAVRLRRTVDRLRQRWTGRRDWSWVRLEHIMVPVVLVTVANIVWQVGQVHCADDSLAIFASGRAALTGHNPFLVNYCSEPFPEHIPYGLAAVALDSVAALAGTFAGVWVVWQGVALLVVPLVWVVGGKDRRYLAVLTASSVLYLPHIATNIGVDNAIVPVTVLVMLYAVGTARPRGWGMQALAAFLSTARFPALFPLLGASASLGARRAASVALVLGGFLGALGLSYVLWGWDAVSIVYLSQFSRLSGGTLNFFALLLQQGWILPSLASAVVQGGAVLALVLFVQLRGYSPRVACAVPLLGVMLLSQYLNSEFVIWVVPVLLLGASVNFWLFVYGTAAVLDESLAEWYLGQGLGIWWPYELLGVLLSALIVYLIVVIVRDEEARRTSARGSGDRAPPAVG